LLTYILAIAFSVLLSAVYAFQNAADVYVKFLMFERSFPQGVWEALLFSAGVLLMWIFSIVASLEVRSKYKAKIKERDVKIAALEEEKKSLLSAFNNLAPQQSPVRALQSAPEPSPGVPLDAAPADEPEDKGTVSA
jgi:uncharacterized integral membrane protein